MLVEDEVMISNLVADCLSEFGFRVHEVATRTKRCVIKSDANVDVLFTDINLPGGMNGAELAERARELRPEMPIVYASGRYKLSEICARWCRARSFVAKPYDPNDVCALLTRLTGGQWRAGLAPPCRRGRGTAPASGCDSCRR